MEDHDYVSQLKARMNDRLNEIKEFAVAKRAMINFLMTQWLQFRKWLTN